MKTIKKNHFLHILCKFIFLIFITVPFVSQAQSFAGDLSIEMTPQLPGAHEEVRLQLTSFSIDLNRSEISWYLNDVLYKQKTGEKTFEFTTDSLGDASKIDIIIESSTGEKISRTITVLPTEVDILSVAHTYTPPFFKGKALVASKGLLKFIAIPHIIVDEGKRLNPENLIYTWEQDGVVLGNLSGYGKNSIVLRGKTVARGRTSVSVTVSSFNQNVTAKKTISVRTVGPQILFYEKHPLEGIKYEKAINIFSLSKEEVSFRAEPYFFSLDDIQNDELTYQWFLNKKKVEQAGKNKKEITLRQDSGVSGSATIEFKIENLSKLLQLAREKLIINFGI